LHDLTAVKRSEQMRVDFVANASHELRTPLAAVSGFIETLKGHARDDSCGGAIVLLICLDVREARQVPKFRRRTRLPRLPQLGVEMIDLYILWNEASQEHDNQDDDCGYCLVLHLHTFLREYPTRSNEPGGIGRCLRTFDSRDNRDYREGPPS
jgi:signal transduction histidine kinase